MTLFAPALAGLATSLSLIVAIGAQNAFVLRQGLTGRHVLAVVLFCAVSDALLITAGVAGFGALTAAFPALPRLMSLAGAAFLLVYGLMRFRAALKGGETLTPEGEARSLGATLALVAAFTWLNPHVYLDTLALIGAVSAGWAPGGERLAFGLGAVSGSFLFFFTLGYGARLVAPVMRRPRAWQVLDALIGATMWVLAASLVLGAL